MMPLDKEPLRCLKHLAKRSAQLEWPCSNPAIPWLIDNGYARKAREFQSSWGHKMRDCAEIVITDAGKAALQQTPGA